MTYKEERIKVRLKTKPVLYNEDCLPVEEMAYLDFHKENQEREVFDLWEMSMPNSQGWLGVVNEAGETLIEGTFQTYIHQGAYQGLMEVCRNIARQHPKLVEFYCVYLNSPEEVAEANLRTKIVFRENV